MKKYRICLETDFKDKMLAVAKDYDVVVIDAQDYTKEQVASMKANGTKVLSYINVGAIESERSYFNSIKSKNLLVCMYENWEGEWWVKAHKDEWRKHIASLAKELSQKGIDGFWVDNLDVYYMADEVWKWSSTDKKALYSQLKNILSDLRSNGYVMVNGGDVFVSKLMDEDTQHKGTLVNGINQETIFSKIESYSGNGKFGKQPDSERKYYKAYVERGSRHGIEIFLLEYTEDETVIAEIKKYCESKGFSYCVSSTLKLGGDIVATKQTESKPITAAPKSKSGCSVWDVLYAYARLDGRETAHKEVIDTINANGHHAKMSDAWCTETVMAAFYIAGGIDLLGGYSQTSKILKSRAEKAGIYHKGSDGILPGDIVLFGKDGVPNHTEFAIGHNVNISGNYNGGCSRRKRAGRSIVGYVRPKYITHELDNLGITILACETILGTYGSGKTRIEQLSAFGPKNTAAIQAEVDRVWDSTDKTVFDLAVYCIAGMASKDKYRAKRLGLWADSVQFKINDIYAMTGKSVEQAAEDVLAGRYGTGAVRQCLLAFNKYDPNKVQTAVNKALQKPSVPSGATLISIFRDKGRATKEIDGLQGNCFVFKQAGYALVVDTMASGAADRILAEIKDCKTVDLYLSHMHSDHVGNANNLLKTGKIRKCYLQSRDTVHKDYQSRYDGIVSTCKKQGVEIVVLKQDSTFSCGEIHGTVLFQQIDSKTDSVNMRSLCTVFTMSGKTILYCGDHHTGAKESKFVYKKHVDVYLSAHHGLFTGDKEAFIKEVTPDWVIRNGWKSWPIGTLGQDPKMKASDNVYQKYSNLLPTDICGRVQLDICTDGTINAKAEKSMKGTTINTKTGRKTVHTCEKCKFHRARTMGGE